MTRIISSTRIILLPTVLVNTTPVELLQDAISDIVENLALFKLQNKCFRYDGVPVLKISLGKKHLVEVFEEQIIRYSDIDDIRFSTLNVHLTCLQ